MACRAGVFVELFTARPGFFRYSVFDEEDVGPPDLAVSSAMRVSELAAC
jgi:hypothetical protein